MDRITSRRAYELVQTPLAERVAKCTLLRTCMTEAKTKAVEGSSMVGRGLKSEVDAKKPKQHTLFTTSMARCKPTTCGGHGRGRGGHSTSRVRTISPA